MDTKEHQRRYAAYKADLSKLEHELDVHWAFVEELIGGPTDPVIKHGWRRSLARDIADKHGASPLTRFKAMMEIRRERKALEILH